MADREKVIKGLECCRRGFCFACPYNDGIDESNGCKQTWANDALELLKAQEPVWISVKDKMPGNNKDIIIYGEWTGLSGTKYREIYLSEMDDFINQGNTPIAWMPLPEPPKEV